MIVDIREYLNLITLFRCSILCVAPLWLRNLCSESLYYSLSWRQTVTDEMGIHGGPGEKGSQRAGLSPVFTTLLGDQSILLPGRVTGLPPRVMPGPVVLQKVWQQKLGRVDVHIPYHIPFTRSELPQPCIKTLTFVFIYPSADPGTRFHEPPH